MLTFNRFLDRTARKLHPSAALVWLLLLRDERNDAARTAVSDLARRAGLSERTVKRHLHTLKDRGLIEVIKAGKPETGPTTYKLHREEERYSEQANRCHG
jgi:DNA-binding transcriptional ArsR family regulator